MVMEISGGFLHFSEIENMFEIKTFNAGIFAIKKTDKFIESHNYHMQARKYRSDSHVSGTIGPLR